MVGTNSGATFFFKRLSQLTFCKKKTSWTTLINHGVVNDLQQRRRRRPCRVQDDAHAHSPQANAVFRTLFPRRPTPAQGFFAVRASSDQLRSSRAIYFEPYLTARAPEVSAAVPHESRTRTASGNANLAKAALDTGAIRSTWPANRSRRKQLGHSAHQTAAARRSDVDVPVWRNCFYENNRCSLTGRWQMLWMAVVSCS